MSVTSFRLKVGDAVHDDVVKEEGLVVDLDVSREQATEVVHIPEQGQERVQFNQTDFQDKPTCTANHSLFVIKNS